MWTLLCTVLISLTGRINSDKLTAWLDKTYFVKITSANDVVVNLFRINIHQGQIGRCNVMGMHVSHNDFVYLVNVWVIVCIASKFQSALQPSKKIKQISYILCVFRSLIEFINDIHILELILISTSQLAMKTRVWKPCRMKKLNKICV